MGLDLFFDKKCTIYQVGYTMIDQTEVKMKTILHELIDCDFGKSGISGRNLRQSTGVQEYDDESFDLVLNGPGYTDITKGMLVEVFEDIGSLLSQGVYKVVAIDYVKNLAGEVDNVYIGLNAIDGDTY